MAIEHGAAAGPARTLALTRIVAGLVIALSSDVHGAPAFARLDPKLVALPSSLSWIAWLEVPFAAAEFLRWTIVGAAIAGAVGLYGRAAFTVVASGLLILLALPHRVGAVTHCHHLLWVAALLAASPCADVWSADAHFEHKSLRARGSYALPVAALRAVVGGIYFFPGVYKLASFIDGVAPAAWLRAHLHWKWMQAAHAPALPIPLADAPLAALALGAVAFELSMPLLVVLRRTRPLALALALAFHVGTALLLFIRFESLAAVLVSLVDFDRQSREGPRVRASWRARLREASPASRSVAAVIVGGVWLSGAFGATQLYPFACYPTFAQQPPATMPSARVDVHTAGAICTLPRPASEAAWVQAFRIAGAYGDALTPQRAQEYVKRVLRTRPAACPLRVSSTVTLTLERLRWDDATRRVVVTRERRVYTASASSLSVAPAEGASDSSSPFK